MDYEKVFNDEILPLKDKIYRFALSLVKNSAMAEDILQEIFFKMWDNKDRWEEWKNLEAISMTMTRNLSYDKLKLKANNTYEIPEGFDKRDVERTPYEKTELNDMKSILRSVLDQMDENQRSIIQLRDIEGYKYKEIADILNISLSQVKVNLHRARITLKENIQNYLKNESI